MLIRILADNPGKTFTRNIDQKFVDALKELLRVGRDPSVKQLLMETLDTFQRTKLEDEGLALLNAMWKKEHERMVKIHVRNPISPEIIHAYNSQGPGGPRPPPATFDNSQNYFSRDHKNNRLPPPHELSSRIEEARTSAGLLSQVTQSTPPSEILTNELVREFADRCQSASRSIQAYMVAENPAPDNDTMETLIETNEQLGRAMSQHQRAVLAARKAAGLGGSEGNTPPAIIQESYAPNGSSRSQPQVAYTAPSGPPPGRKSFPKVPPPGDHAPTGFDDGEHEDPFRDPKERALPFPKDQPTNSGAQFHDQLGVEPYHPGFKETQSYVGRQDSSVGKITMRGALDEEEPVSAVSASSAGKSPQPMYRY
jgi:hypothetical protein